MELNAEQQEAVNAGTRKSAYNKEWYSRNRGKVLTANKLWREHNKSRKSETGKRYRAAHKVEESERRRRYYKDHKEEILLRNKQYRESNKEKTSARNKKWYRANRDKMTEWDKRQKRLRRYGLTESGYQKMVADQNGKCAICGRNEKLHIDHCHRTGKIRGLLCDFCNRFLLPGLEYRKESLAIAMNYLSAGGVCSN